MHSSDTAEWAAPPPWIPDGPLAARDGPLAAGNGPLGTAGGKGRIFAAAAALGRAACAGQIEWAHCEASPFHWARLRTRQAAAPGSQLKFKSRTKNHSFMIRFCQALTRINERTRRNISNSTYQQYNA